MSGRSAGSYQTESLVESGRRPRIMPLRSIDPANRGLILPIPGQPRGTYLSVVQPRRTIANNIRSCQLAGV